MRAGTRQSSSQFGNYSDAQVQEAFGHTIYDVGIYFGHSGTRKIGRLLEMVATGKLVSKDTSTGHHRDHTAALHDDIAPVAAVVVKHYGDKLSSDFK